MKHLMFGVMACFAIVFCGCSSSSNSGSGSQSKIVGKWEMTQGGENIVVEFTSDGKFKSYGVYNGKSTPEKSGTYKLEVDQLTVRPSDSDKEPKPVTIKTLTDDTLVVVERGKEEEFKRRK
jgi:uncharacterized protein (TIGR03066 family)